jgi:hypothetical protein
MTFELRQRVQFSLAALSDEKISRGGSETRACFKGLYLIFKVKRRGSPFRLEGKPR